MNEVAAGLRARARHSRLPATLALAVLATAAASAIPSSALADKSFEVLPAELLYEDDRPYDRRPSFRFRRAAQQSVVAPTRYDISTILKYQTEIGNSGVFFRAKIPLNPRKIIKLELRF